MLFFTINPKGGTVGGRDKSGSMLDLGFCDSDQYCKAMSVVLCDQPPKGARSADAIMLIKNEIREWLCSQVPDEFFNMHNLVSMLDSVFYDSDRYYKVMRFVYAINRRTR